MTLTNFLVGTPVMLLCLVVQIAVVFWCVRYGARHSAESAGNRVLLATVRPLADDQETFGFRRRSARRENQRQERRHRQTHRAGPA